VLVPQACEPALQLQAPLAHASPFAQAVPQAPQFRGSVCRSTQALPHSVIVQTGTQAEPWHCPLGQTFPQAPQLFGSVTRLTQLPPQSERAPPQLHTDATQVWPAPHAWPHVPQLLVSVAVLTQLALHAVRPLPQQAPPEQAVPAQACPQLPQFCGSVARSTHAVPHSARSAWHCSAHAPATQAS
jgi:hypothetical protein